MDQNRDLIKVMKKSGAKIIPKSSIYEINPYYEWIKWLSYEPDFEINDLDKQKKMLELFKKYGSNDITEREYLKVYNYMRNKPIKDIMISKLSQEELICAKEKIEYYSNIPYKDLNNKTQIEKQKENYDKLSMVDAYVLHELLKISFERNMADLKNQIESELKDNICMRYKSLYYASNQNKIK